MNTKEYIEWIASRPHGNFSVRIADEDHLEIESANCEGEVTVYHLETDIIEMRLSKKSDHENFFFLHFELKDDDHARQLCDEMFDSLKKQESRQTLRILLSCTSGMTTSFFAEKLNEAAQTLSLDYEFDAVEYARLYEKGFDYNVILLAPQIAYQLRKAKEVFVNQTVASIPAGIFAKYDAGSLITFIQDTLAEKKKTEDEVKIAEVMRDVDLNALMFVVSITRESDSVRCIERLYEAGKVVLSEELIKEHNTYDDILDILDTGLRSLRKNWSVDAVSISLPGHLDTCDGDVTGVDYTKLSEQLSEHCGLPVFVQHNTAAVAYGYYAQQGTYDIVSYHSQPRGALLGGQGIVYRGMPIDGRNQRAGELGALFRERFPEYMEDPEVTMEKVKDVLIHSLVANISLIAPEIILIRCAWYPDMNEIRDELRRYVGEKHIPVLKHVRDIREYAMLGTLLYGMRQYKKSVKQLVKETE